jgi:hypothetical protein
MFLLTLKSSAAAFRIPRDQRGGWFFLLGRAVGFFYWEDLGYQVSNRHSCSAKMIHVHGPGLKGFRELTVVAGRLELAVRLADLL